MDALWTLREALRQAPPLEGVPTGVPGLDHLFYRVDLDTQGTPRRVPLPGYPRGAVIHLAGVADTGKSLMAEQFAVAQAARGEPVVYVTVEIPAPFLAQALETRARLMGVSREALERSILLLDAATQMELREDLSRLLHTLEQAVATHGIRHVVIDSVTGFYESREMLARRALETLHSAAHAPAGGSTAESQERHRS